VGTEMMTRKNVSTGRVKIHVNPHQGGGGGG